MASKLKKLETLAITGKVAAYEKCVKYANEWAAIFDNVISIQIVYDPAEKSDMKFKFAVFGQWSKLPKEITPDGSLLKKNRTSDLIAERPMPDGSIMYYRNTEEDVAALIEYLTAEGVTDRKRLTAKTWMLAGSCKNKPASEGGGCENTNCTAGCSRCNPGNYCCC